MQNLISSTSTRARTSRPERSEFVPEIVEAAIRKGAKAVWMQEGVYHEEAAHRAEAAGLVVAMDRCILKDHRRLM